MKQPRSTVGLLTFHASRFTLPAALLLGAALLAGCVTAPRPGAPAARRGDEILVAGQMFHTGTRVVLWMDPGGYDAYRVERRFSPLDRADWASSQSEVKALEHPNRYNLRAQGLSKAELERVRGGGWDLPTLRQVVDQFVLHYDAAGTSRQCFKVLHDVRDLSVHFLLDLDGTIYQTLDLKERAWHASNANSRSVGIEIANIGAYPADGPNPFADWYVEEPGGPTRITVPERFGDGGIREEGFVGHPARPQPIRGEIQRQDLVQYDFTAAQYEALIRLTAALTRIFPKLACDYPRDAAGRLVPHTLDEDALNSFQGVLGHFHIQTNKVDPGPAFEWDHVIDGARRLGRGGLSPAADATSRGHLRP